MSVFYAAMLVSRLSSRIALVSFSYPRFSVSSPFPRFPVYSSVCLSLVEERCLRTRRLTERLFLDRFSRTSRVFMGRGEFFRGTVALRFPRVSLSLRRLALGVRVFSGFLFSASDAPSRRENLFSPSGTGLGGHALPALAPAPGGCGKPCLHCGIFGPGLAPVCLIFPAWLNQSQLIFVAHLSQLAHKIILQGATAAGAIGGIAATTLAGFAVAGGAGALLASAFKSRGASQLGHDNYRTMGLAGDAVPLYQNYQLRCQVEFFF